MKSRIVKILIALFITLPITFIIIFFGYFPIHFDIVLHTDNIEGEGICQTYVCPTVEYAAFYTVTFYFGSELHKATIQGYHYDTNPISLIISDVTAFDIKDIDSYVFGIHTGHFRAEDILAEGETLEGKTATMYSQEGILHVDVKDPNIGTTISIGKNFIPMWFWIVYFGTVFLVAIILAILLQIAFDRMPIVRLPLFGVATISVALLSGCFFCGSFPYITYNSFILNWLFLFAISLFINAITLPWLGTAIVALFTTIWYIANYFVITLRNKPIMPADLKAAGTAAEVMGGYSFLPSWKMIIGVIVVILYIILLIGVWKKTYRIQNGNDSFKKKLILRGISLLTATSLIIIGVNTNTFKNLNSFAWDLVLLKSFHEDGMILTFLKSAFNSRVKKPEGYSREHVDQYLTEYLTEEVESVKGTTPTKIIMIMNEAFSDLRTVGLNEKIDVMPFIDSLNENTIEGSLYVSVFGGGTCNTEFEALTGNSLAFLPAGSYPYTEYISKPIFSLASYFNNIGYQTEAFHPSKSHNWNRNMVYPKLGFNTFNSIESYETFGEIKKLHDLPADITDYLFLEDVYNRNLDVPQFLFDVTMQNHSGYERWLDVEKDKSVENYGSNLYEDAQIYLSLIKASDDEVKQLVEHYENSDEPTMIIFFGDHQPGLPQTAMNDIYTSVEMYLDLFKTKFFIWTNYKTVESKKEQISANYLPWLILERGNFALPPYIQMLKEVHEKYPIISSQGVMDVNGETYGSIAELMDDPLIKKYQYIQYANIFDEIDPAWFEIN